MKYITIEPTTEKHLGRAVFSVCSKKNGQELGKIGWYKPWSQMVFSATPQSIWSFDCLEDIAKHMEYESFGLRGKNGT